MTHINAFYGAVEEAKLKVTQAKGELDAAEAALKAHPDYVEEDKTTSKRDTKGHFVKTK